MERAAPTPLPTVQAARKEVSKHLERTGSIDANGIFPKDIAVSLQYLVDDPLYLESKPVQVTPPFPKDPRTNVRLSAGPKETLYDVRGREKEFTLDRNGFCYVNDPTFFSDWSSQPAIAKDFLPEMEALLKREIEGCDEVIFYDARIRQESDQGMRVEGLSYNPYAHQVHVDNTETSIFDKIRGILDMAYEHRMKGRTQVINIWRPIKHPVYDCGLAVCDGASLREDDVLECDRIRQDTGQYGDTMGVVRYRKGYEWYYMSLQDESEVLLFKNYDSATDIDARWCLHTAFDMPPETVPVGAPPRESIEVRALVFTHPSDPRIIAETSIPHPLVATLERNSLPIVYDKASKNCITDRHRSDIDEGSEEIKDAVLLSRRNLIHSLEKERETLSSERDDLRSKNEQLRSDLGQGQYQMETQDKYTEALKSTIVSLEAELYRSNTQLRSQICDLSRARIDARLHEQNRLRDQDDDHLHSYNGANNSHPYNIEHTHLLQTIEHQSYEIERWRGEAMKVGSESVSRSWQAGVDEAVRREREKDAFVIKSLREELEMLRNR